MQYTQQEGKIRSELTNFWVVIEDILVNPKGEPLKDDKVQKLHTRCPQAHELLCETYNQLLNAMGYSPRNRNAQENSNRVFKELGLKYCLNLLDNRILSERAHSMYPN